MTTVFKSLSKYEHGIFVVNVEQRRENKKHRQKKIDRKNMFDQLSYSVFWQGGTSILSLQKCSILKRLCIIFLFPLTNDGQFVLNPPSLLQAVVNDAFTRENNNNSSSNNSNLS